MHAPVTAPASTPRVLRRRDVGHLAVGAALLGSGGGGDPEAFATILATRLTDREIVLHAPDALRDAHVVPVGMVGGTSVFVEKLPSGTEWRRAVSAVCRWSGQPAGCIMGIEVGGMNALAGLVAAVDLDLPYLDADLMGRALPRMDQFTWAVAGLPASPIALAQASGQVVLIDGGTPQELERAVRSSVTLLGGWASAAVRPTPVHTAAPASHLGGVQRALGLGIAHARLPDNPDAAQVAEVLGGAVLATGRVRMVDRHSRSAGFGRGIVTLVDESDGTVLRVESENEFLVAMADGEVVATCPDLICILQTRTALPLSVDSIQAGDDVIVVVLPGPSWWMAPARLPAVAPRAFGWDCDPVLGAAG